MIHQRVLNFLGNICRLSKSSVEKQLAVRQLVIKKLDSNSWFVVVRKLFIMYELPDRENLMDNPRTKASWKKTVQGSNMQRLGQSFTVYYPTTSKSEKAGV